MGRGAGMCRGAALELLKPRGVTQGDVPRVLHPQLCPSS